MKTTISNDAPSDPHEVERRGGVDGKFRKKVSFLFAACLLFGGAALSVNEVVLSGDGCYVTGAVGNKRLYGVLVDQAALKAASLLYFQDEASGLDLNRRMEALLDEKRKAEEQQPDSQLDRKRPAVDSAATTNKRRKTGNGSSSLMSGDGVSRQVQKFR